MACNNCNLVKCGCADSYLTTPAPCPTPSDCPDVQPCSEVFNAQCVVYTGDDILCDPDIVVNQNDTVDQALNSIVAYFCANSGPIPAKESFYQETISTVEVADMAVPTVYGFPLGYNNLTYTNNSGQPKVYMVHASWDAGRSSENTSTYYNVVDGAIIKTVGVVDTIEYEHLGEQYLEASMFDGPNLGDQINIGNGDPEKLLTSPGGNPTEWRWFFARINQNKNIFKLLTLNDGETVSLKFKTFESASVPSQLYKAQLMVIEF